MARAAKSLKYQVPERGGFPHREHRSKKNRKHVPQYHTVKEFKRKKEELIIKELDNENSYNR
jgi:hypothetical protein